ncbi:XrtA/PEP-CTERM system histidine kinase PrsK [Alteromonas halophila]|uniref:XrtA/PEP-CTERM system histidine kinase PrsK n=1 Tax=Alteromonas halophila TaxID=516698 RepID=UPI00167484A1|nr:XrtA/PEP-CTERM system histidine kinase PrsK [Alteromonas halophila]
MIADIGYGLNGLAYLTLLLLLLTDRKAGLAKHLLILASLATLVWSLSLITSLFGSLSVSRLLLADAAKQLVWLLFIASCLQDDFTDIWQVLKRPATLFVVLPCLAALLIPQFIAVSPTLRFLGHTVLALEALVLLEVMYRQSGDNKWAYKPLVQYLGAIHLFEFVTYANAAMVNQIEPVYIEARGYIYLLLVPLLVVAIRRIKNWGVDIFISRDVVLHSSLLLVAGSYLFIMALVGYIINLVGGSWGATVQIVLIVLSLALLGTLFLSNSFRTRSKVFITKHFFANQYDYRVEWVKLTKALSSTSNETSQVYRNALEGILGAVNYDAGQLVKVVNDDFEMVSRIQSTTLSDNQVLILEQLLPYCARTGWLIDIDEYKVSPFQYEGLALDRSILDECEFQLVLPLFQNEKVWGMALLNPVGSERVKLDWEVRDYLNAVTEQVGTFIFHHEAAKAVAENAQFAAFSRMSAFVLHDLKNVLAQIDLILANAEQHKNNPEFIDDTFETLTHTKARMDKMLQQLNEKNIDDGGKDAAYLLSGLVEKVITDRCQQLKPVPVLHCVEESKVVADPEKLSNVLFHLLNNAQQATPDDGTIEVVLMRDHASSRQLLLIEDSGSGMDADFIEHRLFKPFDTTKGNAGMGIGAYDAKNYMTSIGGKLTVQSQPGEGSCFTLVFPLD